MKKFEFIKSSDKLIPGKSSLEKKDSNPHATEPKIDPEDVLGELALVSKFYQNACYTDGRYNCNNWQVEAGKF